ncbi:hypothetical protein Patl1_19604 [Pistacia atlantica]|uniref:Uncharacterized protein n=1 Tax=Pistacia atlantica TaxID=434234 RepID=A0ACC1C105_9ROSI|nr:hypothetical protein Patl1_19604 [Pistacia atlantica]
MGPSTHCQSISHSTIKTFVVQQQQVPNSSVSPGYNCGNVLEHSIQIGGQHITPVDENTVPTNEIKPVKGTPFDFTSEKKIGASIHEAGLGYDHNYERDCGEEKSRLKHVDQCPWDAVLQPGTM